MCHHLPKNAREVNHPNGKVEVNLSGLAAHGGLVATWSADEQKCTATYCHGAKSPKWDSTAQQLPCDSCHEAPPANHKQFVASIGPLPDGCAGCHPKHDDPRHLNGKIDLLDIPCTACHGTTPDAAPPKGIDGANQASSKTVGAHQRHLDSTLLDRIGKVVECSTCHKVPDTLLATGHLDESAPADVSIFDATYDPGAQRCVVACHWYKDPGVVWTDTSGAPRKCDGCHEYPPVKTREGVPHVQVAQDPEVCKQCHQFTPETHVDGHVDFLP
jgi:predicted CxxxxCH...CXXCH cytochrome family protein